MQVLRAAALSSTGKGVRVSERGEKPRSVGVFPLSLR